MDECHAQFEFSKDLERMKVTKVSLKLIGSISFIMAIITLIIVATKSSDIHSLMYASYFFKNIHAFYVQNFEKIHKKPHLFFVFEAIFRSYLHLDDAFSH